MKYFSLLLVCVLSLCLFSACENAADRQDRLGGHWEEVAARVTNKVDSKRHRRSRRYFLEVQSPRAGGQKLSVSMSLYQRTGIGSTVRVSHLVGGTSGRILSSKVLE